MGKCLWGRQHKQNESAHVGYSVWHHTNQKQAAFAVAGDPHSIIVTGTLSHISTTLAQTCSGCGRLYQATWAKRHKGKLLHFCCGCSLFAMCSREPKGKTIMLGGCPILGHMYNEAGTICQLASGQPNPPDRDRLELS